MRSKQTCACSAESAGLARLHGAAAGRAQRALARQECMQSIPQALLAAGTAGQGSGHLIKKWRARRRRRNYKTGGREEAAADKSPHSGCWLHKRARRRARRRQKGFGRMLRHSLRRACMHRARPRAPATCLLQPLARPGTLTTLPSSSPRLRTCATLHALRLQGIPATHQAHHIRALVINAGSGLNSPRKVKVRERCVRLCTAQHVHCAAWRLAQRNSRRGVHTHVLCAWQVRQVWAGK